MKAVILSSLLFVNFYAFAQPDLSKESPSVKWVGNIELGTSINFDQEASSTLIPELAVCFGIEVDQTFSVSVGTGIRLFKYGAFEEAYLYPYIPAALDLRFMLGKGSHVPFLYLKGGYAFTTSTSLPASFPLFDNIWGGATLGLGLGYRYAIKPNLGFGVSVGYQMQQTHFSEPTTGGLDHTVSLKTGITFGGK